MGKYRNSSRYLWFSIKYALVRYFNSINSWTINCKTAWDIFKEASHELSDGFDEEKIELYQNVILKVDGVKGIKEIKGRSYGNNEVIDV